MTIAITTRAELENLIGADKVVQYYDDDKDGAVAGTDLAKLEAHRDEANDFAAAILFKKGWNTEDALTTIGTDRAVIRATTQIFAGLAGERRPAFYDSNGDPPFKAMADRGRAYLRELVKGEVRSLKEQTAGNNATLRGRRSTSDPVTIFGRDVSDPEDKYGDGRGF